MSHGYEKNVANSYSFYSTKYNIVTKIVMQPTAVSLNKFICYC